MKMYEKIQKLAEKYGYQLVYCRNNGNNDYIITIREVKKYHSEIMFDRWNSRKFKVQTTSYGSMEESEYEEYLNACKDSYKLVKELNKLDLSKLK